MPSTEQPVMEPVFITLDGKTIELPFTGKHLNAGFVWISDKTAGKLAGKQLPKHGYEVKITIVGLTCWLTRTPLRNQIGAPERGWVWAVYAFNRAHGGGKSA